MLKYFKKTKVYLIVILTLGLVTGNLPVSAVSGNNGNTCGIPVLSYHCIDKNIFGQKNLFVPPSEFDAQMKCIKEAGFTAVTFRDIADTQKMKKISKPVVLTFDDGYENNYIYAYPILKKYGFKATIFLVSNFIGQPRYLSVSEIKDMLDIIDFEDHTKTHPVLSELDTGEIENEFAESAKAIEAITNRGVIAAAYPFGIYDNRTVTMAGRYFKYAVTTKLGLYCQGSGSNLEIRRITILDSTGLDEFKKYLGIKNH